MFTNRILSGLPPDDLALLEPNLKAVDLPVRKQLQKPKRRVESVYFVESGFVSVVANGRRPMEVGIIGREGISGVSAIFHVDERVPHENYVQLRGRAQCLPVAHLREAIRAARSCTERSYAMPTAS